MSLISRHFSGRDFAVFLIGATLFACGARQEPWTPPPDDAFEAATRTVFRSVNSAEREADFGREEVEAMLAEASELMGQGAYAAAADIYDVVARALPNWYAYRPSYATALWRGRGDQAGALDQLERCLELSPTNLECRRVRGLVLLDRGERGAAIDDLAQVAALRVGDPDVAEPLGRLLLDAGRADDANDVLGPAFDTTPRRLSLALLYARSLEAAARINEARALFEHVRDLHRDPVRGGTYLMHFLERHGPARDAARVRREVEREIERRIPDRNLRPL